MVKAALLGKIKDAACIDIGEQLFMRSLRCHDLIKLVRVGTVSTPPWRCRYSGRGFKNVEQHRQCDVVFWFTV